jgi:tetratricopeptide (TPR) repeat protein
MNDASKKRWLLKDREGRVRGPFATEDILGRISRGEMSGEEKISLYPSTNWMPISNDPQFYDKLLESLDHERRDVESETDEFIDVDARNSQSSKPRGQTGAEPPPTKSHRQTATRKKEPQEPEASREEAPAERKGSAQKVQAPKVEAAAETNERGGVEVIELKKLKTVLKKQKAKKATWPLLLIVAAVAFAAVLLMKSPAVKEGQVRLVAPRAGQPALTPEQSKTKTQLALQEYVKDSFSSYMRAQTELVQVLEGDPKNAGVIALMCLTYLELWPFAYQDAEDLQTVSTANQMASRLDPAGVEAATCRVVELLVRGRYIEAKGVTEMILDTFARENKPPIAFYYFKALLFESVKDFGSALSYSQSAQQLWKQWLRVYNLEARILTRSGQFSAAANKYRGILASNPNHAVARIELGVIEYKHLRNYQEGQKQLELAFAQKEKVPGDVEARGLLGLAELALQQQNNVKALEYARRAYALNASEGRAKEILLKLGGEKSISETKILDSQLVFEGDQLVREGDCNAAQAHYKAAYEINRKNAMAALKAGECLWSLSLSTEAIGWMDKAIGADPKLVDAYVLLSDYYTQRYNYTSAAQILSKARALFPANYKVFRGYALAEWRRKNSPGAADFAQKAIQLYGADVESYVILARAQMDRGEYAKAFEAASKAIEIDKNHQPAQTVYAEALGGVRGLNVGIDYLSRLVNTYPTLTDYRLALGHLYMKDQRFASAQDLYQQVIRIEDKPKKAYMALGNSLKEQKRFDEAREAYFKAATLDPSDVEPLFLAGRLYLDTKQPSEARQQFQRVLRVNKDFPLVSFYIGRAALLMNSTDEALEYANQEKAKNPNLADPYILAAEAYTEMKQYSACAGEYVQAVRLRPANSDIYVKMARCYRMSGNLDAAVSMINQASHQESANAEAWKEQGAIYEVRQDRIKAIEAYQQYLVLAPNAPDREQIQQRIQDLSR